MCCPRLYQRQVRRSSFLLRLPGSLLVILAAGAVISLFSVTLVVFYGQTRILFAISRDGMIPVLFHHVDPRTMTPVANQMRLQAEAAQASTINDWDLPVKVTIAIGDDKTWKAAMASLPWQDQELIVVGSSGLGPIMSVFVGSNSGKIVRNAPVICLVLPRGTEADASLKCRSSGTEQCG